MKTDLTSLTKYDHPLYLGFMLGVEKYGEEMLAFESQTSREGQYFEYGRQPLFLNLGGATTLWRGIDIGASAPQFAEPHPPRVKPDVDGGFLLVPRQATAHPAGAPRGRAAVSR